MQYIIETNNLTKYYRDGTVGVENLSLCVEEGIIFGFLGSNGAGKTTTIRMLMNLIFPSSGSARIFGKDVIKHHLGINKDIGYLPSSVTPHRNMTGEDFLDYMGKLSGNGDITYRKWLLQKFELSEKDLRRKIKKYSTGMARKVAIVQTFQNHPKLVIMDEPTDGLDPVMQDTFYDILRDYKNKGGSVFISSHHLLEVEQVCDIAAIIRNGHLAAVENIQDLSKYRSRFIEVEFKNEISKEKIESENWELIEIKGNFVQARITGEIDGIIKLLANFDIKELNISSPTLQDVFMSYYQEDQKKEHSQ